MKATIIAFAAFLVLLFGIGLMAGPPVNQDSDCVRKMKNLDAMFYRHKNWGYSVSQEEFERMCAYQGH